jgi:hypothetical protein
LLMAHFPREILNCFGQDTARSLFEASMLSEHKGCGRLAGDFFPAPNGKGQWLEVQKRYIYHGALGLDGAWLAGGADGPLSTVRFECGRDCLLECAARIFLEKALLDKDLLLRIGEKDAEQIQAMLDDRTRYISWGEGRLTADWGPYSFLPGGPLKARWYSGSGWQDRSAKLYAAAAAVEKVLGGK